MSQAAPTKSELVDLFWRSLWTFVAAGLAGLTGTALLDLTAWQAAGGAGLTALFTVVAVYARQKAGTIPGGGR